MDALQIPSPFITSQRDHFTAFSALCFLCCRYAYPTRLSDMEDKFGVSTNRLSRCINDLSLFIYKKWNYLLDLPTHIVTPARLEKYAEVIHAAGAPTREVTSWLDCKIQLICKPGTDQREVYNGYYGGHALKYQGLGAPDGLAISVFGPVEGRRADGGLLTMSGLREKWVAKGRGFNGRRLLIYGDPAYPEDNIIMSGRKEASDLPDIEQQFNTEMSRFREAIEWIFGKIIQNWRMFDLRDQLKLYLSPIGRHFLVACLLTNAHTCLHGSEVSGYYNLDPPELEEYFRLQSI